MAEELQPVDLAQGQGPPELIIKLGLQFLAWKVPYYSSTDKPLLTSVGVVCKKWKALLETDEVAVPLCLNMLKSYDDKIIIRNRNGRAQAERQGRDFQDEVFYDKRHELLAKILKNGPPGGRSYKDIFVLSQKMGKLLNDHSSSGPDVPQTYHSDTRSLREASIQEYSWIVRPTIERLRDVFDNQDDNTEERLKHVEEMKKRLLHHARGNGRKLSLRKDKLSLKKEELAEDIGRMMVMLAASNDLDNHMFVPSSPLASLSLGEVIESIETIKGGEIAVLMSLQVNRTSSGMKRKFTFLPGNKKLLGARINELSWPENPVDSINFLVRHFLPRQSRLEDEEVSYYQATEEKQVRMWNDAINKFWLGTSELVHNLFVAVYNDEVASRFTDVDHIVVDTPTHEIPIETLKKMFDLRYEYFGAKIADRIWHDMDPSLCEQIFEIYHRQAETFREAIREEYANVYSETSSLEHNAKVLLDVFLEVPPHHDKDPRFRGSLTAEACDIFVERMEESMNRWNELIDLSKTDDAVLWDPETMNELNSFELMFGHMSGIYRKGMRTPTLEFCVPEMVEEYLFSKLSSAQKIPRRSEFEREVGKFYDDYAVSNNAMSLSYSENVEREARGMRLVQDFRTLTSFIYTRDHAMFALVPLLPHLSGHDCRKLVYALFIQLEDDRNCHSKWEYSRCRFSLSNYSDLGIHCMMNKIPCALGDGSDLSLMCKWHREQEFDFIYDYKIWGYLFGLPLPDNIISAMGEFMVENLYQGNITDVNNTKILNVRKVMLFLERFCYGRPESAHIVWDYIREAVQNAIAVVEDLPENEIQPGQHSIWNDVITLLVVSCIDLRAKRLLSHLRRLYQGTPLALLPENFVSFKTLVKRVKQEPLIINDTIHYHQFRSDQI